MGQSTLGLALVVWISCWPMWGQAKHQPSDKQQPTSRKTTDSQRDQRGTKDSPVVVNMLDHPQSETDAAKTKEENRKKEFNDSLIAWSAVGAAIFTGLLVIVGWRGVNAAKRTLKAIEAQSALAEAALMQWVSIENWRSELRQPRMLRIDFDVVNPSNFPLTMAGFFKFNGTLPGAPTMTFHNSVLLPRKPLTNGVDVLITDDQAQDYVGAGLRISLHGEYFHVGASKQRSVPMEIHTNIVCRSGQPTMTEFESICEKRSK